MIMTKGITEYCQQFLTIENSYQKVYPNNLEKWVNSFAFFYIERCRWRTTLDFEILSSLDTLRMLSARFNSLAFNTTLESILLDLRGAYDIFLTFYVWVLLLIVHPWNSSPLRSNLLQPQCTCTVPPNSERPHGVLLCERVNALRYSLFHLLNCLITTASELSE